LETKRVSIATVDGPAEVDCVYDRGGLGVTQEHEGTRWGVTHLASGYAIPIERVGHHEVARRVVDYLLRRLPNAPWTGDFETMVAWISKNDTFKAVLAAVEDLAMEADEEMDR
jgi:hypothetical protein